MNVCDGKENYEEKRKKLFGIGFFKLDSEGEGENLENKTKQRITSFLNTSLLHD